jgi:NADPH-dependent curcumin reductase CurA
LTDTLGALGPSGPTAYFGITEAGKVKAGEFVVVSEDAGATGSIACQIALVKGAKVPAIAGKAEKVQWLRELGCDALNYRAALFPKQFEQKNGGSS